MHDLPLMAATEWARANAAIKGSIEFGCSVALVEFSCRQELEKLIEPNTVAAPFPGQATPTPAPEKRASALELAAVLGRYVAIGTVLEGALALADRLATSEWYERAAELIFRAAPSPSSVCFESWADLIELADAVDAWLRTGEMPADLSMLQRAFPSVAAYQ